MHSHLHRNTSVDALQIGRSTNERDCSVDLLDDIHIFAREHVQRARWKTIDTWLVGTCSAMYSNAVINLHNS